MSTSIFPFSTGETIYRMRVNSSGAFWNGATYETYNAANWATYAITCTERGATGQYVSTDPDAATTFTDLYYLQTGGTPAATDTLLGADDGSDFASAAVLARLGPLRLVPD